MSHGRIHRARPGTRERFIGLLIEHYAGIVALRLWKIVERHSLLKELRQAKSLPLIRVSLPAPSNRVSVARGR
jgi:hypothetical protein